MKKAGNWLVFSWHPIATFVGGFICITLLLWFQLGQLVPALSKAELTQWRSSSSVQKLIENPLELPLKAGQLGTQLLRQHSSGAARFSSTVLGIIVAGCFYYVLRNWYTRRVASLGTFLFISSAWFLHAARSGTSTITYSLLIAAMACVVWLQKPRSGWLAIGASAAVLLMLLYIPGMIWLVIPALLWQGERISRILTGQNVGVLTVLTVLCLLMLAPLGWALFKDPALAKIYFGLPVALPAPLEILKNTLAVPMQLFVRGPNDPAMWLGRLPLLDWFGAVMFVVGAYAYFFKRRLDRTWFIALALVVGSVLVGLGGSVNLGIIMPFVYLIIAGGIALMLQQWFTVFPRNPVARTLGAILMTVTVLMSAYYNINHYFIAWPNAPETKQEYTIKL